LTFYGVFGDNYDIIKSLFDIIEQVMMANGSRLFWRLGGRRGEESSDKPFADLTLL